MKLYEIIIDFLMPHWTMHSFVCLDSSTLVESLLTNFMNFNKSWKDTWKTWSTYWNYLPKLGTTWLCGPNYGNGNRIILDWPYPEYQTNITDPVMKPENCVWSNPVSGSCFLLHPSCHTLNPHALDYDYRFHNYFF